MLFILNIACTCFTGAAVLTLLHECLLYAYMFYFACCVMVWYLSHHVAPHAARFAAECHAGRRYQSTVVATGHHGSMAHSSECEQCHVVS